MEVDNYQESAEPDSTQPHIEESTSSISEKPPKDKLISMLDRVEKLVERMRRDALRMEEEKDILLTTLDTVKNSEVIVELHESEQEEVFHYAEHISNRCLTVEVHVRTTRDRMQEDALYKVNGLIDALVVGLRGDPAGAKARCLSFMNSCSSQPQGPADKSFETAVLGCTLDDQKRVKKRLQGLLEYIDCTTKFA
ncbi:BAG family molecular chaperone regulator 2 [Bacillus rossius redtenbacheri]|uniref:BAG family molecular chaperone regulator 2 n=1 Tax=Bacillus rossius redtenbacheri TaxID=93214 RepID=UPI002FDD84EA